MSHADLFCSDLGISVEPLDLELTKTTFEKHNPLDRTSRHPYHHCQQQYLVTRTTKMMMVTIMINYLLVNDKSCLMIMLKLFIIIF